MPTHYTSSYKIPLKKSLRISREGNTIFIFYHVPRVTTLCYNDLEIKQPYPLSQSLPIDGHSPKGPQVSLQALRWGQESPKESFKTAVFHFLFYNQPFLRIRYSGGGGFLNSNYTRSSERVLKMDP